MRKHHHKLFYGKYTHKATFKFATAGFLWPTTKEHLEKIIKVDSHLKSRILFSGNKFINSDKNISETKSLASYILKHRRFIKFRIQNDHICFYGSENVIKDVIDKYWDNWIGVETVDPALTKKLDKNKRLCTKLPHNKYQYQVFLKKKIYTKNNNFRKGLAAYIIGQPEVGLSANKYFEWWLQGVSDYSGDGYFYIKDEKSLTPIYMLLGENIEKIIQFIKVKKNARLNTKVNR